MPKLAGESLVFHCPSVDENARCSMSFVRTLRIPDDGKAYPLPPGIGQFDLVSVDEHAASVPQAWQRQGGFMLPMYQAEALWIQFYPSAHAVHVIPWPFAIQVATGGVNAISGSLWKPDQRLVHQPQDYVVVPGQPWLDGFCVGNGFIRQFVAMPFGEGFTAEEQLMGEAKKGGLQIRAVPMKRDAYESLIEQEKGRFGAAYTLLGGDIPAPVPCICPSFGFAPGGRMVQDLYKSDFEPDVWDEENAVQTFIHVLNSLQWQQVTGRAMPHPPASASKYTSAGLPWFDYYDDSRCSLEGSERLAGLESVAARKNRLGDALPDNDSVVPSSVIQLKKR